MYTSPDLIMVIGQCIGFLMNIGGCTSRGIMNLYSL